MGNGGTLRSSKIPGSGGTIPKVEIIIVYAHGRRLCSNWF